MEDLKDIVSKNIIYLRTNNKMTQSELGERLNYSDKAVSKWERGEAVPDAYVLKELSAIFHVTVDYLLSEHSEKELQAVAPRRVDRRDIISFIAFSGTWTLGITVFVGLWLFKIFYWQVLIYTLPISLIVLVTLTAVWGRWKSNIFNISFLVWSIITAIYLTFKDNNWWFLYLIGIPAQIIIFLSFTIKFKGFKNSGRK